MMSRRATVLIVLLVIISFLMISLSLLSIFVPKSNGPVKSLLEEKKAEIEDVSKKLQKEIENTVNKMNNAVLEIQNMTK